ncbi:hypothetical protein HDU96_000604 [Phlyctochytrium bullatum]|nr:hypothetical protein HDU96_000604 [Phlyctochytrium bullatum]
MALTAPPALTATPVIAPPPLLPRAVTTTATTNATTEPSFCDEFLQDCAQAAGAFKRFETVYTRCDNSKPESPMAFCIGCPGRFSSFDACFDHADSYPIQVPTYSQQMWVGLTPKSAAKAPANGIDTALKPTVDKWAEQCAVQCMNDYRPKNKGEAYYAWYGTRDYTVFSCGCSPDQWVASRPFNITGLDLIPALDGLPKNNAGPSRSGSRASGGRVPSSTTKVKNPKVEPNANPRPASSGSKNVDNTPKAPVGPNPQIALVPKKQGAQVGVPVPGSPDTGPGTGGAGGAGGGPVDPAVNPASQPVNPAPQPVNPVPQPVNAAPPPQTPYTPWNQTLTKDPNGGDKASGIKFSVASVAVIMSLVAALF